MILTCYKENFKLVKTLVILSAQEIKLIDLIPCIKKVFHQQN